MEWLLLSWPTLILLGLGLRMALRLTYGVRGPDDGDPVYDFLRITGWVLIILGLMPAIESLASDVRERSDLVVDVQLPESAPRLAPEAELALFRAAQEALANVIRHADATRVTVRLVVNADSLRLLVTDDGNGLQNQPGKRVDAVSHLGLAGMRERIAALGGRAWITAASPQGTTVSVELPSR